MRGMLVLALELDGHTVDDASNALDGLKRLQQQRYNLVLSDYAMPGGTGAWMIQEAMRQGLMEGTAAVIVTAQPDLHNLDHVAVISKPLDLDRFLERVKGLGIGIEPFTIHSNGGLMSVRAVRSFPVLSDSSPDLG